MRKNKIIKENAITLVALVITVIILIILAGVSLNLALGQNGIFVKSKEAVDKYKDSAQKEQNTLENIYVDMGGKPKFNPENLSIGEPINEETYGYKVTDYDISVNGTTEWRLFYQDKNYTYIISKSSSLISQLREQEESILDKINETYSNGSNVGTIGKKLNSSLLESKKCFTEENTTTSIKITAWLCDEMVWKDYCDENASFAIGSPTLDLFISSWDATSVDVKLNDLRKYCGDLGFTEGCHCWLDEEEQSRCHEIYDYGFCLSSPIEEDESLMYLYDSWDHNLCYDEDYTGVWCILRPIVAIPTDVFTQNYHLANE